MRKYTIAIVSIFSLFFDSTYIGATHIKDHIIELTSKATTEWAMTRECNVSVEASGLIAQRMDQIIPALEMKSARYNFSPKEDVAAVQAAVAVYLDQASLETFGPKRRGYFITTSVIKKTSIPVLLKDPDSGVIDIDGADGGAEILIDGTKKGNIRQAFILSVGHHTWKTMKCEETIDVQADKKIPRYCTKDGRILPTNPKR